MRKTNKKPVATEIDPGETDAPKARAFVLAELQKPVNAKLDDLATVAVESLRLLSRVEDAVHVVSQGHPAADRITVSDARFALRIARKAVEDLMMLTIGESG